jgi:hypothetical protein
VCISVGDRVRVRSLPGTEPYGGSAGAITWRIRHPITDASLVYNVLLDASRAGQFPVPCAPFWPGELERESDNMP